LILAAAASGIYIKVVPLSIMTDVDVGEYTIVPSDLAMISKETDHAAFLEAISGIWANKPV
jgi:hypothetical protein